uniref:Uncharacterized protein n=1 Tax=Panagrolaimus sp. ES5 TaxID=591445 RepID=A0AC34GSN2_9BILA
MYFYVFAILIIFKFDFVATAEAAAAAAAAAEDEDASCNSLLQEFTAICFRAPPKNAVVETQAFCQAFRDSCRKTILIVEPPKPLDPAKYCAKHRERFRYVCPDPTRLGKYSEVAIEFCPRYQSFCPDEPLPAKPEPFKEKVETKNLDILCPIKGISYIH